MNSLNIYFCGSMRGVKPDSLVYQKVVEELEKYGVVLTRHVAFPEIWQENEKGWTDQQIYQRDNELFQKSNIMVADVTAPSHGVGMELGWATTKMNYSVLCIYRKNSDFKISALVNGCSLFDVAQYETDEEAVEAVVQFMQRKGISAL